MPEVLANMNSIWPATKFHPPIAPNEAHVWSAPLGVWVAQLNSLESILSAEERHRANALRLIAPRQRFVIARAALRTLLGRYLDISPTDVPIDFDPNKKPRLAAAENASDLRFNVTHSGGLALMAITRGCEIGVDLEQLRGVQHAAQIAQRYFHPAEIEAILAAPPAERDRTFLRCWTLKEAVLKAVGIGITGSLAGFHVPMHTPEGPVEQSAARIDVPVSSSGKYTQCWLRRLSVDDDYAAAVAFVGADRDIRCFTFAP
jgi:4'-phosphopantetheinyl transferase